MALKNLLEQWKILHLLPIFEEQKIDESVIQDLDDEQITFLAQNIGDRIRLKKAIASLKHSDSDDHIDEPLPKKAKFHSDPDDNRSNAYFTSDIPIVIVDNNFEVSPGPSNLKIIEEDTISLATTETIVGDNLSAASSSLESFQTKSGVQNSSLGSFDLETFLKNDILGEALLVKGAKCTALSNTDRDRLCELLIKHLVNQHGKLTTEDFLILSKKITNIFQKEHIATYYVAPIPKTISAKNVHEKARGKLVDKQRNLFYLVKKLKNDKIEEGTDEEDSCHQEISQEAKDSQIWLRKNTEPQCEVLHHWKLSYPARKSTQLETIGEFLELWPILKTPISPDLINYDFVKIHELSGNFDLEVEFEDFFQAVLKQRKKLLSPADNTILQLLDTEITTDSRRAIQLYLLAPLVPPKARTKVKKVHWKPSITEAREGIFIHVLTPGDIEQAKKDKINSMFSKGLTVQPYLIIVGPNLNNISQALVIIDQNIYPCNSVLEALDFCFKSYIVLDAKYPFESQHLWYLIQWIVYKYRAATEPKILFINDLLSK